MTIKLNKLNRTLVGSFSVFTLLFATSVFAGSEARGFISDLGLAEFNPSDSFNDLDARSDLATTTNYADVEVISSENGRIIIRQRGTSNAAKVIQTNSINSKATVKQKGTSNAAMIEQGNVDSISSDNIAIIEQWGVNHNGYISQVGHNNLAILKQCEHLNGNCVGESNHSSEWSINQTGNDNIAEVYDSGQASYDITQTGGDEILVINNMSRGIYIKQ